MLKDIFCYIKMSIRGELETDGGKKKIKYPFQKIAIVIALALWTITAINILYSESSLSGEERNYKCIWKADIFRCVIISQCIWKIW